MHKFAWGVILGIAVLAQATQTNLMFAAGVTLPWFILGMILSPIWWAVTKRRREDPWQWFNWLNAGAYIMLALFVISRIVDAYVSSQIVN